MAPFFRKFNSFFINNIRYIGMTGMAGVLLIPPLPDTLFLSRYKQIYGYYKDGNLEQIDKDTEALIDKVLTRINMKPREETQLEFFPCYLNDPIHKGSCLLKSGGLIGLPTSFAYKTEDDVKSSDKRVTSLLQTSSYSMGIDWESETGSKLLKSLLLTEQEKAFAIAKEIHSSRSSHLMICMALKVLALWMGSYTVYAVEKVFRLPHVMHVWARALVACAIAAAYVSLYILSRNGYYDWLDGKSDYLAGALTPYYAKGGVGYYEKVIQRNAALKSLNKDWPIISSSPNAIQTFLGFCPEATASVAKLMWKKKALEICVEDWQNGILQVLPLTDNSFDPFSSISSIGRNEAGFKKKSFTDIWDTKQEGEEKKSD